jgi:hypothetical protein
MNDRTAKARVPIEEAWAVVEGDPASSDRRRVLFLVDHESEAAELVGGMSERGTWASVLAITNLDATTLTEPA